jgi:hypothetical protein
MLKRPEQEPRSGPLPKTTHIHIQIPEELNEKLKAIRDKRSRATGEQRTLSHIYQEAVELYLLRFETN